MLNMDPVVQVNVSVGSNSASAGVFDVGAILGPTAVTGKLDTTHRFKAYDSYSAMIADGFTATDPEAKAAAKYFGADPAPAGVVIIFYDTAENTTDTPTIALLDAIDKGAEFYSVYYCPKASETDANIKTNTAALLSAINSQNRGMLFYGVTGSASAIIASGSLLRTIAATGAKRAIGAVCTSEIDDAAAVMGEAMGLSRTHEQLAFALCYKSVPAMTVNSLSQSEIDSIKEYNGNVYVQRTKTRAGFENGTTPSGLRFDDVLFLDRIAHDIQVSLYSMIADSDVKLPQADSTTTLFISEIYRILEGYYNAGVLADAAWRGPDIGTVETGAIVEHGYTAFASSFDEQSTADRALRKAMPITVLLCLAGSVESIVLYLDVQT